MVLERQFLAAQNSRSMKSSWSFYGLLPWVPSSPSELWGPGRRTRCEPFGPSPPGLVRDDLCNHSNWSGLTGPKDHLGPVAPCFDACPVPRYKGTCTHLTHRTDQQQALAMHFFLPPPGSLRPGRGRELGCTYAILPTRDKEARQGLERTGCISGSGSCTSNE